MAGGGVLAIRLRFHNHAPEQSAVCLALHQQAADQLGGDHLRWTAEEGVGQSWEIFGDGLGGDGSGFLPLFILLKARQLLNIPCPEKPQPTQSETTESQAGNLSRRSSCLNSSEALVVISKYTSATAM